MNIRWNNRCLIHGNEIRTADPELRFKHLLNARERLLARHQFVQGIGLEANAGNAPQHASFPFKDADQHGLESRSFSNAMGDHSQRLF